MRTVVKLSSRGQVLSLGLSRLSGFCSYFLSGGTQIRTGDTMIVSHVLYQLSYPARPEGETPEQILRYEVVAIKRPMQLASVTATTGRVSEGVGRHYVCGSIRSWRSDLARRQTRPSPWATRPRRPWVRSEERRVGKECRSRWSP